MFKPLIKLIQAFSSNSEPGFIAHAFACGMILGFMPKDNLFWYILFILIFFMRIQRSVFSLSIILGALCTAFLDPLFDNIGYFILTQNSLENVFSRLLDIPFVAFTKFNNTIVMGAFAFSIVMYFPMYFMSRLFLRLWRKYPGNWFARSKFNKWVQGIPLVKKISKALAEQ